jgi:thiamine-monophosphate kinase
MPSSEEGGPERPLDEFSLIGKFFSSWTDVPVPWKSQGIGDDCAFLDLGAVRLAVTCDMMAIGTHFLDSADPYTVGRKALAVNLSDLAAAGASPRAFFLSIGLPAADPAWLERFSAGLREEARRYRCALLGGDTTKAASVGEKPGKTVISITAIGELAPGAGTGRTGAAPGDDIWVSGTPGDAFAALLAAWGRLRVSEEALPYLKSRMDTPTPRVELGQELLGIAGAAADVSDGFCADLGHILERSGVSAEIFWPDFPRSDALRTLPEAVQKRCALSGGDDYELVFTAPAARRESVKQAALRAGCRVSRVGRILPAGCENRILEADGSVSAFAGGFNHFSDS